MLQRLDSTSKVEIPTLLGPPDRTSYYFWTQVTMQSTIYKASKSDTIKIHINYVREIMHL